MERNDPQSVGTGFLHKRRKEISLVDVFSAFPTCSFHFSHTSVIFSLVSSSNFASLFPSQHMENMNMERWRSGVESSMNNEWYWRNKHYSLLPLEQRDPESSLSLWLDSRFWQYTSSYVTPCSDLHGPKSASWHPLVKKPLAWSSRA